MALDGLDDAGARIRAALAAAVVECAKDLKTLSQQRVPVDQFDLHNSAKVSTDFDGDHLQAAVSYDTPYALVQHEDPTLQHDAGRTADYLGAPLRENAGRYQRHIADQVRDALDG